MRSCRGLLMAVLVAAILTSCTSVRNGLGTRDSVCFASLPVAELALGGKPTFAGVRYLPPISLIGSLDHETRRRLHPPKALLAKPRVGVCLVAYRGRFSSAVTARAWRPEPGPYDFAVVVVRQADDHVLGVVLLPRAPIRFGHLS
ncbi:MAG: hypothetical protein ACLPQS_03870 [Acidimicrobiales bacterium]